MIDGFLHRKSSLCAATNSKTSHTHAWITVRSKWWTVLASLVQIICGSLKEQGVMTATFKGALRQFRYSIRQFRHLYQSQLFTRDRYGFFLTCSSWILNFLKCNSHNLITKNNLFTFHTPSLYCHNPSKAGAIIGVILQTLERVTCKTDRPPL